MTRSRQPIRILHVLIHTNSPSDQYTLEYIRVFQYTITSGVFRASLPRTGMEPISTGSNLPNYLQALIEGHRAY
jgi:hypothetical protein